jgi:hypothetical protein
MYKAIELFDKILAGDADPSQLMFFDLEYIVIQKRIFEIGVCDALRNTILDYQTILSGAELQRTSKQDMNPVSRTVGKRHEMAVVGRQVTDGRLNCEAVVERLVNAGMTSKTIVVVWATN